MKRNGTGRKTGIRKLKVLTGTVELEQAVAGKRCDGSECLSDKMETKDIFHRQDDLWNKEKLKRARNRKVMKVKTKTEGAVRELQQIKRHSMYKGKRNNRQL